MRDISCTSQAIFFFFLSKQNVLYFHIAQFNVFSHKMVKVLCQHKIFAQIETQKMKPNREKNCIYFYCFTYIFLHLNIYCCDKLWKKPNTLCVRYSKNNLFDLNSRYSEVIAFSMKINIVSNTSISYCSFIYLFIC